MADRIPQEVALSICGRIQEENRARPHDPAARQCRKCEACCGRRAIKPRDRACCLVRLRYVRMVVLSV